MIMLSELSDADREERIRSWKSDGTVSSTTGGRPTKKVSYAESSSEEEEEEKSESEFLADDLSDEDAEDDEDEDAIGSTDDDEVLGQPGSQFTQAEMRILAKHIASVPGWFKGSRDWTGFVDKVVGSSW